MADNPAEAEIEGEEIINPNPNTNTKKKIVRPKPVIDYGDLAIFEPLPDTDKRPRNCSKTRYYARREKANGKITCKTKPKTRCPAGYKKKNILVKCVDPSSNVYAKDKDGNEIQLYRDDNPWEEKQGQQATRTNRTTRVRRPTGDKGKKCPAPYTVKWDADKGKLVCRTKPKLKMVCPYPNKYEAVEFDKEWSLYKCRTRNKEGPKKFLADTRNKAIVFTTHDPEKINDEEPENFKWIPLEDFPEGNPVNLAGNPNDVYQELFNNNYREVSDSSLENQPTRLPGRCKDGEKAYKYTDMSGTQRKICCPKGKSIKRWKTPTASPQCTDKEKKNARVPGETRGETAEEVEEDEEQLEELAEDNNQQQQAKQASNISDSSSSYGSPIRNKQIEDMLEKSQRIDQVAEEVRNIGNEQIAKELKQVAVTIQQAATQVANSQGTPSPKPKTPSPKPQERRQSVRVLNQQKNKNQKTNKGGSKKSATKRRSKCRSKKSATKRRRYSRK